MKKIYKTKENVWKVIDLSEIRFLKSGKSEEDFTGVCLNNDLTNPQWPVQMVQDLKDYLKNHKTKKLYEVKGSHYNIVFVVNLPKVTDLSQRDYFHLSYKEQGEDRININFSDQKVCGDALNQILWDLKNFHEKEEQSSLRESLEASMVEMDKLLEKL